MQKEAQAVTFSQLLLLTIVRYLPLLFIFFIVVDLFYFIQTLFYEEATSLFYWVIIAFLIFYLPFSLSSIYPKRGFAKQFIIRLMLTISSIGVLLLLDNNLLIALWMGFIFIIVFSIFYRESGDRWLLFVILAVCVIDMMDLPHGEYQIEPIYLLYLIAGMLLALIVAYLRHFFYRSELKWRLYLYVNALKDILHAIFDCYLKPDYPSNRYIYEKRIHDAKNKAFYCSTAIANFLTTLPFPNQDALKIYIQRKELCDEVFLLLLDSGQLRHRISDHTTFRFCSDELTKIKVYFEQALTNLQLIILKETKIESANDSVVSSLEGIYEMVLQVVAKEPISFLLFIQTMKSISMSLENRK